MSGQRGIGATRETDPRSSGDPSASEIAARADRRDGRSGASPTVRYDPAAVGPEPHAALAADCQAIFGNTTMRAALEGTDTGPASLMVDAMALGAAGVQAGQAVDQIQSNHHNQQALAATGGPSIAISARRKSMDPAEQASSIAVDTALKRGGKPLAPDVRADMERALGADLSGVRIHTDGAAAHAAESVSAHAFAVEQHVVFNRGTYRPHTTEGRRLLAHELQHVVQHQEGRIPAATEDGLSVSNPMDAHEREADRVAAEVVRTPMVDSTEAAPIDTEAGQDVQAGSADVAGPDAAVSRKAQSGAVGMAQTAAGPEQFAQLQGSLTEQLQGLMVALQQVMDDNQEVRVLFGEAAGAGGITGELQAVAKPFAEVMQTIQATIAGVGIALPSGADGDMGGSEPGAEAAGGAMGGVSDLASGAMQGAGDAIAAATQMVGGGGTGPEGMPGMADLGTVLSKAQGEYKSVLGSLRGQEREVVSQILSAMDQIGGNLVQLNSMEALLKEGKDLIGNNAETASREAAGPIARAASFAPPTDSAGKSLPAATQAALALKLGKSVSRIRVHTGPNAARFAASLNANAVTVGQDIYFARGAWRPGSTEGEARIAHEAHHAIIGGGAPGVSQPGDAHEREASAFGDAFAADGGSRLLARVGQSPVTSIALAAQVQRRLDATPAPSPTYSSFDGPDWTPSTTTEFSAPSVQAPSLDPQSAAPTPMSSAPEVAAPSTPAGDAAVWSREAAPAATSAAPSSQAGGTAQQAGPDPAAMAALLGQSSQAAEVAVEGSIEGKREARSTEEELEAANAEDESAAELEAAATEGEASAENGENGEGEAEPGAEGATGAPADAAAAAGGGDTPAPPPPGLSADSADGLVSAFKTATPTQKAYAWPTLGTDVGTKAVSEGQDISGNVPELNAEMSSTATAPEGDTAVASPGGESAVSVEPEGESVAPEIEATPALGAFQATGSTPDYNAEDPDNAARAIGRAIGSVSTRDGSVPVSAGPAPTVPLQGATDPQQLADRLASSGQEGAQAAQAARQAVLDSPGAERVQLREVSEAFQVPALTMPSIEATEAQTDMERYVALGLPGDVQAAFDELNGPDMEANLAQAEADAQAAASERDASVQTEIDQAQVDARAASEEAQRAQQGEVQRQRAEIDRARADTVSQQQQAVADVERRAASEHASRTSSINERVAADQARIRSEYASAESKARSEVAAGERKAAAEKRKKEQEAQNQSWWDRAKNFVASCIDALKKAVTAIFDAVRKAVTKVLDAVKSLAASIIDAAADFIKSAIRAFGELLKGWIDGLLGDIFPGLAEALNNLVDAAVEYAESKIDDLAEGLKDAINKLVDGLHAAINAVLSVYEAAISLALEVAEAVVTGDWTDLLLKALEAALRIAGINPDDFYAFVGKAEDTIKSIVDNPGGFIGNLLESVKGGFGQFADNFGTHLQSGFVEWLTGQAGDAGITMPSALDAKGIFSLVTQVLGLTKSDLKEKVEKHFGEKAGAAFEYVWDSVEALIEGGVEGLYDKIAGDLDGMVDQVMGEIKNWLITKVVMAAVMKVASMFNPVGAIVQAVMMAWKVYEFLHDQINRIYGVVTGIVNSIADIAAGALGGAMNRVEQALGDMVPVAIDLLAKLLGIGGMGKKVRKVIEKVQAKVDAAIDKLIERMKGLFSGGAQKEGETEQEGAEQQGESEYDGQIGEEKTFSAEDESHRMWIVDNGGGSTTVMVASTPMSIDDRLANWTGRLDQDVSEEHGKGGPMDRAAAERLLSTARTQSDAVKSAAARAASATDDTARISADNETEQAQAVLAPTLAALFNSFKDVNFASLLQGKLTGPDKLEVIRYLEADGLTAAEAESLSAEALQQRGRQAWMTAVGGGEQWIRAVANVVGDAIATRKLDEIVREDQPEATKFRDGFLSSLPEAWKTSTLTGKDAVFLTMQSKVDWSWLGKGVDQTLSYPVMQRGEGADTFYSWMTKESYKRELLDDVIADAGLHGAAETSTRGAFDPRKIDGSYANRAVWAKWAETMGSGGSEIPSSTWDGMTRGSKWWSPDNRIAFEKSSARGPESNAAFETICKVLALAPEWYTQGMVMVAINTGVTTFVRPTVWDGMMSPLWVQQEGIVGMTGGGAAEFLNGAEIPSSKWSKATAHITSPGYAEALQALKDQGNTNQWTENPGTVDGSGGTAEAQQVANTQQQVAAQTSTNRAASEDRFSGTSPSNSGPGAVDSGAPAPTPTAGS